MIYFNEHNYFLYFTLEPTMNASGVCGGTACGCALTWRFRTVMIMLYQYWSGIGDGILQARCVLPHRGNMVALAQTLTHHLQVIISHSRSVEQDIP